MKYLKIATLVFLSLAVFAFKAQYSGAIQGKIAPAEGIQQILLISGIDTIQVPHANGSFLVKNLQARTYTVLVKGILPYLDHTLNEVAVIDSATTDIGNIKLMQE